LMSAVSRTDVVRAPEGRGKRITTYADGKLVAYNTAVAYPIGIVFAIAMLAIFIYATKKHTASQKA
ncbi:MAG: carbon starvation protein A, partial [Faecalibacterium sp.]|nr:carbon starvation protein A [Faecalibacterium sp.]